MLPSEREKKERKKGHAVLIDKLAMHCIDRMIEN